MTESACNHWLCLLVIIGQALLLLLVWAILEMRIVRWEISQITDPEDQPHADEGRDASRSGLLLAAFCFAVAVALAAVEGFCRKCWTPGGQKRKD